MSKLADVINELRHTTIAQVVRQIASAIIVVTPIWIFAGSYLEAAADEAFVKMMAKNGVSPTVFANITKKVGEIDAKTDNLSKDNDKIRTDIGAVKRQNEDLLKQQERTTKLVERLLEIQLQRNWQ